MIRILTGFAAIIGACVGAARAQGPEVQIDFYGREELVKPDLNAALTELTELGLISPVALLNAADQPATRILAEYFVADDPVEVRLSMPYLCALNGHLCDRAAATAGGCGDTDRECLALAPAPRFEGRAPITCRLDSPKGSKPPFILCIPAAAVMVSEEHLFAPRIKSATRAARRLYDLGGCGMAVAARTGEPRPADLRACKERFAAANRRVGEGEARAAFPAMRVRLRILVRSDEETAALRTWHEGFRERLAARAGDPRAAEWRTDFQVSGGMRSESPRRIAEERTDSGCRAQERLEDCLKRRRANLGADAPPGRFKDMNVVLLETSPPIVGGESPEQCEFQNDDAKRPRLISGRLARVLNVKRCAEEKGNNPYRTCPTAVPPPPVTTSGAAPKCELLLLDMAKKVAGVPDAVVKANHGLMVAGLVGSNSAGIVPGVRIGVADPCASAPRGAVAASPNAPAPLPCANGDAAENFVGQLNELGTLYGADPTVINASLAEREHVFAQKGWEIFNTTNFAKVTLQKSDPSPPLIVAAAGNGPRGFLGASDEDNLYKEYADADYARPNYGPQRKWFSSSGAPALDVAAPPSRSTGFLQGFVGDKNSCDLMPACYSVKRVRKKGVMDGDLPDNNTSNADVQFIGDRLISVVAMGRDDMPLLTDRSDRERVFHGPVFDIGAPGEALSPAIVEIDGATNVASYGYGYSRGSSFAAPLVAGLGVRLSLAFSEGMSSLSQRCGAVDQEFAPSGPLMLGPWKEAIGSLQADGESRLIRERILSTARFPAANVNIRGSDQVDSGRRPFSAQGAAASPDPGPDLGLPPDTLEIMRTQYGIVDFKSALEHGEDKIVCAGPCPGSRASSGSGFPLGGLSRNNASRGAIRLLGGSLTSFGPPASSARDDEVRTALKGNGRIIPITDLTRLERLDLSHEQDAQLAGRSLFRAVFFDRNDGYRVKHIVGAAIDTSVSGALEWGDFWFTLYPGLPVVTPSGGTGVIPPNRLKDFKARWLRFCGD